jgi:uncharacterized protein YbbK (DUF523 family)
LDACRYNGKIIDAPWLNSLTSRAEIIDVCPEIEIGLGVPRKPISLIKHEEGLKIIQEDTNLDISEELISFCEGYLRFITQIDAFVLKSKSPSCGLGTSKIKKKDGKILLGSGIFTTLALRFFPNAIFVDELFMKENNVNLLFDLINKRKDILN